MQVRLERVWGILQLPVSAKLDWVIRYTGQEAGGLFEPALQAWEQAAAAVLERERYCTVVCIYPVAFQTLSVTGKQSLLLCTHSTRSKNVVTSASGSGKVTSNESGGM